MLTKPVETTNSLQVHRERPAWQHLLLIVAYFLAAMFIGQFVGMVLAAALYSVSLPEVPLILHNFSHPNSKAIVYLLQGFSSFFGFVVGPVLYLYHWGNPNQPGGSLSNLLNRPQATIIPLGLAAVITVCFMAVNSPLIEWNATLELPAGMQGFEQWARGLEEQAARITRKLIEFESIGDFLLALLVMAVLAAVGEELLFRGLLQPVLGKIFRNAHVGIWLSALFFSLFHFQFFGLLPRMALGILFGYLFYWSGSLVMPILGHFINNGLTLLLAYLASSGVLDYNMESTEALPLTSILVCLVVGVAASVAFYQYFNKRVKHEYVEQRV
jgi:membrane protease YdiL (CAAX protease family)